MATYLFVNGKMNKLNFDRQGLLVDELSLLLQVKEYLDDYGLSYEVVGSYIKEPNAEQGDIDIKVEYEYEKADVRRNAIVRLARCVNNVEKQIDSYPSLEAYFNRPPAFADKIIEYSQEKEEYVDTTIDNRFKIHDSETGATIDLCFEAEKELCN